MPQIRARGAAAGIARPSRAAPRRARGLRLACGAIALLGALALSGTAGARASHAPARAPATSRLQVTLVEYRLALSSGVIRAGRVSLDAIDLGLDPHNVRLQRLGASQEIGAPELRSRQRWDATLYLRPGIYRLWCSLPEHARLGMHATLRVIA